MAFDLDDDELKATRLMNGSDKPSDRCKYCGDIIEQPKRGRKRDYCRKEECIRKMKNEVQRKWYANKMKILEGTKNRIIEQKDEKKIIYSSTDKAIHGVEKEDFTREIELARQLGAVKFEIQEEIRKLAPEISKYDKEDQVFLHNIENLLKQDTIYEEDVITLVKKHIENRPDRRIVKDKISILNGLQGGIMKNPNQYVVEFIRNRDKRQYNPNKEGLVRTSKKIKMKRQK